VTYDGKYLVYNEETGRVEETVPPVNLLEKFRGLFPQYNVIEPFVQEAMGAPRPFANLRTGEVRTPGIAAQFPSLGEGRMAQSANEAAKLLGVNIKKVGLAGEKKWQEELLQKLSSQRVRGNIPRLSEQELEAVKIILLRTQKQRRSTQQGAFR
jgi:hypothetical protein